MTGIERLRALAYKKNFLEPAEARELDHIADQIEREHAEDREAIAWVREHGGLERVRAQRRESMPRAAYERKKAGFLGHIAECETALGRRNERIKELGCRVNDLMIENTELRRRAMPEGCKWPTVDGRKVDFKTSYQPSLGVLEAVSIYSNGACEVMSHDGIIKPVSEIHVVVPAADGEPLEAGQTVWDANGDELVVGAIEDGGHTVTCRYADVGDGIPTHGMWSPSDLTHQRPVLDADGVPIKVGDTVYEVGENYPPFIVGRLPEPGAYQSVRVVYPSGAFTFLDPNRLTHAKPEPIDTWQRIEEDATLSPEVYCHRNGIDISQKDGTEIFLADTVEPMARDLVRRCRALAERERGE